MIITAFYAGLLALCFVLLSTRVIARRRGERISLGDGGDPQMLRRIRGHANFAEYVPFALLLMALLEMGRTSIYILHALGILLVLGRLLHGVALSFTDKFFLGRTLGMVLTFTVLIVAGVLCIWQGFRGMTLTM
jgi:uncharacterized membrane protein YecN with MAPEG domain